MDMQFMDAVSRSLNEAIASIINICESLRKTFVSPTETCSNYSQIREYTVQAHQGLIKSETMIEGKLKDLDESMENLTSKKYKTEQLQREKKQVMEHLQTKKEDAENSLMCSKSALVTAEENVELANFAMSKHQYNMNSCRQIKETGTILLAIPVIGWIAGPIMMAEGDGTYHQELESMRAAELDKQHYVSKIWKHSKKVSHYAGIILRTQDEILQTSKSLKKFEKKIKEVKRQIEQTADIQENVRIAVHLLNVLSGRVTVLENQTRCVTLWKAIINIMEEVMKAIFCIAENRLLFKDGVPKIVKTLRENVGELLLLCSSSNKSEYDDYY